MALLLSDMVFKITKGNKTQTSKPEAHASGSFQPNLYDGLNRNMARRLIEQIALIGSRGDFLEVEMIVGTPAAAGRTFMLENIYLEAADFTGMLPDAQYAVFGPDSPFVTASPAVQDSMLIGVDKLEFEIVNNVLITGAAAQNVEEVQKIRGILDDRMTVYGDAAASNTCTKWTLKIKPTFDNVILVRAGAIIWMKNGTADQA